MKSTSASTLSGSPPSTSNSSTSLWDRLPTEIKEQIFNKTDIPTRFLNNQILTKPEIEKYARDIWIVVINTNSWDNDVSILPQEAFPTILNGLDKVQSREVYHQLSKMKPDRAGLQHLHKLFATEDFWMAYFTDDLDDCVTSGWNIPRSGIFEEHDKIPQLLINIPMRQFWVDELTEALKDMDSLKLFFVAGSCGHFELFQYLYNDIFTHPLQVKTSSAISQIHLLKMYRYIITAASERGFTTIIQFLLTTLNFNKNSTLGKYIDNIVLAAMNGHLDLVKLLVRHVDGKESTGYNYALNASCENGHIQVVKLLVQLEHVDPTATNNEAIRKAASKGHFNIVKFFMTIPGVDLLACDGEVFQHAISGRNKEFISLLLMENRYANPRLLNSHFLWRAIDTAQLDLIKSLLAVPGTDIAANGSCFIRAVGHGNMDIVRFLLGLPWINPTVIHHQALRTAAQECHLELVKLLMGIPAVAATAPSGSRVLSQAAAYGHLDIVRWLLTVPGIHPSAHHYEAIHLAAYEGFFDVLKVLLNVPGVDATGNSNIALRSSARSGNVDILRMLLAIPGVDPTVMDNCVLQSAVSNGHFDYVKVLLQVPAVDPTCNDNEAVRTAAVNGYVDIVKLLLEVPEVNAAAMENESIRLAARYGHAEVVKVLLGVPGVDATAADNEAVRKAAAEGHLEVVRLLLNVPGVDATANNNEAIRFAARGGNLEIVRLLVQVPGVDAAANDNEALKLAASGGRGRMVKFLLGLPGVDATAQDNFAIKEAAKEGHLGVTMLLVDVPGVDVTEAVILASERQHMYVVLLILGHEKYRQNADLLRSS
ncbi:hypothetical protein HDU76_008373 [Blyttiomyces sp. JEL0837]|nr:hypothetical protein HDU76_008373 [Blyttiomyces sp. JEL0837]